MRLATRPWLALLAGSLVATAACGARLPEPCGPEAECDASSACLVGRCRPEGTELASPEARRLVLEPSASAVLDAGVPTRPGSVTALGQRGREARSLLLRFEPRLARGDVLEAAFLVLERDPAAPPEVSQIELEIVPLLDPWSSDRVSFATAPRTGLSPLRAIVPPGSEAPLRIEVTELLRERAAQEHGLCVRAASVGMLGARVRTGPTPGGAPRLELYVR